MGPLLKNGDLYVTTKSHQQAQEPPEGVLPEASLQEPRNVRLGQSKQLRSLDLLESALPNDRVDASDQLRF